MKIGIDGGALSVDKKHQFGNYTFTVNLVKAIEKYDRTDNQYILYTFSQPNINFKFGKKIKIKIIKPKYLWSKIGLSLAQITDKNDVFLAINQSIPFVKAKKIIGFSHGLSFYFFKKFYSQSWKRMFRQHQIMMKYCDSLIVPSVKVKDDLKEIFINQNKKIEVLPYGIPFDLKMIKKSEHEKKEKYFLAVGMNHQIKNFKLLKKLFEQFKESYRQYQYKLIIVNSGVKLLNLIDYYKKATALLTASFYESFNFPVLEALYLNCPVVGMTSAIIPEMWKFTLTAKNDIEFVEIMNKVVNQNINIDSQKLEKMFSWKRYIKKLITLYD